MLRVMLLPVWIVPRSVTLIGTALDVARYWSPRYLFGAFANMKVIDSWIRVDVERKTPLPTGPACDLMKLILACGDTNTKMRVAMFAIAMMIAPVNPLHAAGLTCVVVVLACVSDGRATIFKNEAAAKVGMVRAPKDVSVGDAAPNINAKPSLGVSGTHHFVPVEGAVGRTVAFGDLSSPQDSPARVRSGSQGEIKRHLDRMV